MWIIFSVFRQCIQVRQAIKEFANKFDDWSDKI